MVRQRWRASAAAVCCAGSMQRRFRAAAGRCQLSRAAKSAIKSAMMSAMMIVAPSRGSGSPTSEWMNDMDDNTEPLEQSDEDILSFDVSDDALEAAASTMRGPAFSFPNAPTVSILVMCCSNDVASAPA